MRSRAKHINPELRLLYHMTQGKEETKDAEVMKAYIDILLKSSKLKCSKNPILHNLLQNLVHDYVKTGKNVKHCGNNAIMINNQKFCICSDVVLHICSPTTFSNCKFTYVKWKFFVDQTLI
jgi:hypothetical protein